MVIDGETVITGLFNFTKAADENNAENLLIIHFPYHSHFQKFKRRYMLYL